MLDTPTDPKGPTGSPTPPARAPLRLSSRQLLRGSRELEIEHAGQIYRLRLTALGKLILTK